MHQEQAFSIMGIFIFPPKQKGQGRMLVGVMCCVCSTVSVCVCVCVCECMCVCVYEYVKLYSSKTRTEGSMHALGYAGAYLFECPASVTIPASDYTCL